MRRKILLLLLLLTPVLAYFAYDRYMDTRAEREINRALKEFNLKGEYKEVDYSPLSGEVRIEGLRLEGKERISVERLVIREISRSGVNLSYRGLRVEEGGQLPGVKEGELIDGEIVLRIDREGRVLSLERMSLLVRDGFDLILSLRLSNVDIDLWESINSSEEVNPFQLMSELGDIRISHLRVSFIDRGVKRVWIEEEAYNRGISPEELKRRLIADIERNLRFARSDIERQFLEGLKTFIDKGKRIDVYTSSEREVSLGRIFSTFLFTRQELLPQRIANLLGLKIEVR
jgi:hypothetical protein